MAETEKGAAYTELRDSPYTKDEQRVCEYLQSRTRDVGCGNDPIGFLIASHAWAMDQRKQDVGNASDAARSTLAQKVLETVEAQKHDRTRLPDSGQVGRSLYDDAVESLEQHNQVVDDVTAALRDLFHREGIELPH